MRCLLACFFIVVCVACNSTAINEHSKVNIQLSKDSQKVYVSGLEYAILQELKKDSLTKDNWAAIFPVYAMPADTDLKDFQSEIQGTYLVTDSSIVFKPDTAFKKQQQYFARFYGNGDNYSTNNMIRSKSKLKGPSFIEVTFQF